MAQIVIGFLKVIVALIFSDPTYCNSKKKRFWKCI